MSTSVWEPIDLGVHADEAVHWQSGLVTAINATSDLVFDMALDGEVFQVEASNRDLIIVGKTRENKEA